jgi:hypothetical protein
MGQLEAAGNARHPGISSTIFLVVNYACKSYVQNMI